MIEEGSFRNAILFSSICHLLLMWGGSRLASYQPLVRVTNKTAQELEVFYSFGGFEALQQRRSATIEKEASVIPERNATAAGKEELHQPEVMTHPRGKETSFEEGAISELHLSGEEKPLYFAYYQNIRERIRQSVRKHYPERVLEGQVFLNFVVFANGQLKEVVATEKRPFQDRWLKEMVLQSVIQAAPFPPFPEGLRRPFVPFRVLITFVSERKSFIGE